MAKQLNRFLTPLDAAFLYFERPSEPLHIGSCMIYDGRIEKAELAELLEQRLHLAPRYRHRVLFSPMAVSHPLWVDDPDFDVDRHISEVELEGEVDEQRLGAAAAKAYEGMLDRSRPLWSATLIRGLPDDNTAVVWKVHHAMVDGVSGVDLTLALNDLEPHPEPPSAEGEPWSPEPLPDGVSLLQQTVQQRLGELGKAWTDQAFDLLRPGKLADRLRRLSEAATVTLPKTLTPAPRMPFNRPVRSQRDFGWSQLSFTELRHVKGVLGGTVNDLVLAILGGALGRYLRSHSVPTAGLELRAMCPVSMRRADERGQLGNLVSSLIAPLYVGVEDPLERLEAVQGAMDRLKSSGQAEGFYELTRMGEAVPPSWHALAGMLPFQNRLFNTVSTNVPGPQIPLYQGGRRLLSWLPMGVCSNNIGLFVAILTYERKITLGLTVDPHLVPDVWNLAACITETFDEYRQLAGVSEIEIDTDRPRKPRPRSHRKAG